MYFVSLNMVLEPQKSLRILGLGFRRVVNSGSPQSLSVYFDVDNFFQ